MHDHGKRGRRNGLITSQLRCSRSSDLLAPTRITSRQLPALRVNSDLNGNPAYAGSAADGGEENVISVVISLNLVPLDSLYHTSWSLWAWSGPERGPNHAQTLPNPVPVSLHVLDSSGAVSGHSLRFLIRFSGVRLTKSHS